MMQIPEEQFDTWWARITKNKPFRADLSEEAYRWWNEDLPPEAYTSVKEVYRLAPTGHPHAVELLAFITSLILKS